MKIDAQKLINKLGELATDVEEKVLFDYGDLIDLDNWVDADSDDDTITYAVGYRNACLNAIKIIKKQMFQNSTM